MKRPREKRLRWVTANGLLVTTGDPPSKLQKAIYVDSAASILREMVTPTVFEKKDADYYIARGGPTLDGRYTVGGETFTVQDNKVWYLGSLVCEPCFSNRIIVPEHGCQTHRPRICSHKLRRLGKDCGSCIPWSVAGFWHDRVKCLQADVNARDIARSTKDNYIFRCNKCQHSFDVSINSVTNKGHPSWCPYCSGRSVCGAEDCHQCTARSLAGWSDKKKLAGFVAMTDSKETLSHKIALSCNYKGTFHCDVCPHYFESAISEVTKKNKPSWCPYCAGKNICGIEGCNHCTPRSLAGWNDKKKLACFLTMKKTNEQNPHNISISNGEKGIFQCNACPHRFDSTIGEVTRKERPVWCPYCANKKLCGIEGCTHCNTKSLASWGDKKKLDCFISMKESNEKRLHMIAIGTTDKGTFQCDECVHTFDSMINNVTKKKNPTWCPYCSIPSKKLCTIAGCNYCTLKSLAGWSDKKKLNCFISLTESKETRTHMIAIGTHYKGTFQCDVCTHDFVSEVKSVTSKKNPSWCPYCAGRVCGKEDCEVCAPCCSVCKITNTIVKGPFHTVKGRMCRDCYRISGLATPNMRAKVNLEIYFLAELQRLAEDDYRWREPTSWDCPILPGLAFKPDMLWAFDSLGNMFSCAGACKLDRVAHIIILEILEVGIEQHSVARSIPDTERERQIRGAFPYVPVDVLYVVVAAYNHPTAHRDDQFFRKPIGSLEYELVSSRAKAWTERVAGALSQLRRMHDSKLGETVFIGHWIDFEFHQRIWAK